MKHPFTPIRKNRFHPVLKFIISIILYCTSILTATAELVINSGTTVKINSGTTLISVDHLLIKAGAILSNSGNLIVKKNLTNQNGAPNILGNGTFEFSGTTNQQISGQNIFQIFRMNNASGVTLNGNTTVNGTLNLIVGLITLGGNNLFLGSSALITGGPSASAMIVPVSTGELRKEFASGFTGVFIFPVGDATGTAEYSPVTLNFSGGTFSGGNYVGVKLVNAKYPDANITGDYLNRYWTLGKSGISNFTCDVIFQYLAADVTGTESAISCSKVNPVPWITYALADVVNHRLTPDSIMLSGSYTGVHESATPPDNRELQNITIGNGVTTCYDAVQVLTVAGNGATFLIQNGGDVTLVAGQKISILPGATVDSGGTLYAYITTTSSYCSSFKMNPLVSNVIMEGNENPPIPDDRIIKIYPNPSTGFLIIDVFPAYLASAVYIDIYTMQGEKIISKIISGESSHQFSLAGLPAGIYLIQSRCENHAELAKIVKN
ncbi:MAG: T9SS type A sorting domain-containing protein [Bacteroidales bacterium]|jgi:hypothetical protein|nr:T9SS type A sorting domain-containing protein [Bacteroidales bacterium]